MYKFDSLYLYKTIESTKVLGAGNRFAIWVQGCDKRCENCIVPDSWSKVSGGYELSIEALVQLVVNSTDITGVTISGGEPFLQSLQLAKFIELLDLEKKGLDYIVYTGLNYDDIVNNEEQKKLLNKIDLLIDGEYIEELNANTPLLGSSNQGVYILSDSGYELANAMYKKKSRELEFVVKDANELFMVGIPPKKIEEKLKEYV